jgi:hypothetical protein
MSNESNIHALANWSEELEFKAKLLHEQLASLRSWVEEAEGDEEMLDALSSPYYELLEEIYEDDLPLARAVERSDLLLRYQGPAVEVQHPKLSLLASVFSDVRIQVGRVAKSIAGISESKQRLPEQMDLNLAALARGSLYVGYALPSTPDPSGVEQTALFEDESLYEATREAVRVLGVITKHVSAGASFEEVSELVDDPKVLDTTLSAIENLSPSGRKGVQSIRVSIKELPELDTGTLSFDTRSQVRQWLEDPNRGEEYGSFTGTVREIDLDARRFELRQLDNEETQSIRCSYGEDWQDAARDWLDQQVRVYGRTEKDSSGRVRFINTEQVEFL